MESLRANYVLSNTPDFLFRRFRRDSNVLALAHKSPAELREIAIARLVPGATVDDIVEGYAAIVALSYKEFAQVEPELVALEAIEHYWARALVAKVRSIYRTSETHSQIQLSPPLAKPLAMPGSSVANTASMIVLPTPTPKVVTLISPSPSNNESAQ